MLLMITCQAPTAGWDEEGRVRERNYMSPLSEPRDWKKRLLYRATVYTHLAWRGLVPLPGTPQNVREAQVEWN